MEMKNIAKEKKEIEILCFDVESYGLPDEAGTSATIFFTLKVGERELDVRGDIYWEFSPSRFYDDENCRWFESWGFTISVGVAIFEEEDILCDRLIELGGINLHYLDIRVYEENEEGERIAAEWKPRSYRAAWEIGSMVDDAIWDSIKENTKKYLQEAVRVNEGILYNQDYDDPEKEFAKEILVEAASKIVNEALEEVGNKEIALLYTQEGDYQLL